MPETFVPLVAASARTSAAPFTSMNLKVVSPTAAKPASESFKSVTMPVPPEHDPELCAKPVVTLQRNGDYVTGIRIQCGCGQVIELACVY